MSGLYGGSPWITYNTGTNATIPVQARVAQGGNVDIALVPGGAGSLMLCVPDGTVTGGNKRGQYVVDLQAASARGAADQVAFGQHSIVAGVGCKTTALAGIAMGNTSSALGPNSVALGALATANSTGGVALSYNSTTSGIDGQVAFGFKNLVSIGKFQRTFTQLYTTTSSTTATKASTDGAAVAAYNQLVIRANSASRVRLRAVARDATNNIDAKEWTSDVLVTAGATAASTAIVGTPTITSTFATAGASGWTIALSVDTTLGALAVTVTSSTTDTVNWNIQLDAIEVM